MTATDTHAMLVAEKYVVLTTKRKNGTTVPTAVWLAPLPDGGFGFTTELSSGKVKRIRNFPDVTLQPSNMRGAVKPGTSPIAARAAVLVGDDAAPVEAAIAAKYTLMVKLMKVGSTVRGWFSKPSGDERAAIRVELVDPAGEN